MASEALAEYTVSVNGLRAVVASRAGDDTAWARISESLTQISAHFEGWGHLLRKLLGQPNATTVMEIASAIDELNIVLYNLDKWLNRQGEQFWLTLQTRLRQAQGQDAWLEAQEILGAYVQELNNQKQSKVRQSYKKHRLLTGERWKAGAGLLAFAHDLQEAVDATSDDG